VRGLLHDFSGDGGMAIGLDEDAERRRRQHRIDKPLPCSRTTGSAGHADGW
jgi:hypothetical protein